MAAWADSVDLLWGIAGGAGPRVRVCLSPRGPLASFPGPGPAPSGELLSSSLCCPSRGCEGSPSVQTPLTLGACVDGGGRSWVLG